ncbi:DNA polymerase sigma subunit [Pseudohyphozyma bogoriensis]|nr:DNA polymerase sigma subunit [Pseudohyphozyma bogoriensis]
MSTHKDRKRRGGGGGGTPSSHTAPSTPAPDAGTATPPTKKGRYERNADAAPPSAATSGSAVLVSRALKGVVAEASSTPSASTPGTATPTSARASFADQEDFISFDFDDDDDAAPSPRHTPRGGPQASGSKRKLDDYEEKHEEKSRNLAKRERERSTPWCYTPGVEWDSCETAIDMLNAEAKAFIRYISPTPVEHELRLWTIELIRRTIKSRWSDAEVECFGSVGTGLYLPGGDIDLVVLSPSFPAPPLKPNSSLLHHLASLLLNSSLAEPSSLLVIAKARVPIVKFTTRYGGFSVDLSVNQKNGVDAAVRVRDLLENFAFRDKDYVEPGAPAGSSKGKEVEKEAGEKDELPVDFGVARSLVMLVKAFLNQRGMNEVFTGGLGSYSIICLVVSFLQTGEIAPSRNVGLFFVEFLEYYGKHFNYNEAGITLRGKGGYFNKHQKGWFRPNQPYLLSIEDPNDISNDVSGGSHNILRVRQTLAGAFDLITATLYHRVSHFAARRNPSIIPLTSDALPNADPDAPSPLSQSILGSVIGMSRAAVTSREENVALHREGILQGLIEKSTIKAGSKKALKRARKEEQDKAKRDRTIARLEMKKDEREQKDDKAAKKKAKRAKQKLEKLKAAGVALDDEEREGSPEVTSVARKLFQQDDEESRYSIGSQAQGGKAKASKSSTDVIFVHGSDSESGEDGGSGDDDDVVLGGNSHGDRLTGGTSIKGKAKAAPAPSPKKKAQPTSSESSEDSGEEVVKQLMLKGAARVKAAIKDERQAKQEKRNAFWSAKGPKDDSEVEFIGFEG